VDGGAPLAASAAAAPQPGPPEVLAMTTSKPGFRLTPDRSRFHDKTDTRKARGWRERFQLAWSLIKETVEQWSDDEAARQAASLALYTLLSIAPMIVIAIAIAGFVFGEDAARGQISQQVGAVVGAQAGDAIQALVANARAPSEGILSTVIGLCVLLVGASGVFGELQTALNHIWEVKPKPGRGITGFIRDRFFSFSMVMGVAFLLLVSLVVSAALATLSEHYKDLIPLPALWQVLNVSVALGVSTVLFGLIFKLVPDAKTAWKDVLIGGFVTAVLFSIGKVALAWYVGRSATTSPFGAAGSLVALVVWVYYSAQILFVGAEFTQVYASRIGSRIEPKSNAVRMHVAEAAEPPADSVPPASRPAVMH
jgi:membrane protein